MTRRASAAAHATALLLLLLLSACSSLPPGALERSAQGRTIEGRLSVRYKDLDTAKEESLSGRFVWTTSGDETELSLLDPLGQTVALISTSPAGASITFRDGRRIDGATPEALTARALGWTVPLRGLRFWLEGRPDPDRPASSLADGRVRQDDWTLRFSAPDDTAADPAPKRIDLAYPGPPAEIEMRLVVDRRGGA